MKIVFIFIFMLNYELFTKIYNYMRKSAIMYKENTEDFIKIIE
jgi:hypothetical protein